MSTLTLYHAFGLKGIPYESAWHFFNSTRVFAGNGAAGHDLSAPASHGAGRASIWDTCPGRVLIWEYGVPD